MLKLSRHLLRLTAAILTGHAPVRGHLYTVGPLTGTQPADSAGRRPKPCNILFAAARRWLLSALQRFWEPVRQTKRNKHSFSKRPLPLHKRHRAAESELKEHLRVAQ
jgi:hypothetical protein